MSMIIPLKCSPRYNTLKDSLSRWIDGVATEHSAAAASSSSSSNTDIDTDIDIDIADPAAYQSSKPFVSSKDIQKDLLRITSLRHCLSDAILKPLSHRHAVDEMALQDSHEYHAVLELCQALGFLPFRDDISNLRLRWNHTADNDGNANANGNAQTNTDETHGSFQYDKACVLYNIAALESFLASDAAATTMDADMAAINISNNNNNIQKEAHKQAVKHYQNAAAAMKYCQLAVSGQNFDSADLSDPSLEFWQHTMLAMAQTSAYQMAKAATHNNNNNNNNNLLSYIAMGAVPEYNEALRLSQHPLLRSNMPKSMQKYGVQLKFHSLWMQARAEYHQALHERQTKRWGYEIKRLELCQEKLNECLQFVQNDDNTANDKKKNRFKPHHKKHNAAAPPAVVVDNDSVLSVQRLLRWVQDRTAQANRDNSLSYGGEQIPHDQELPSIPPKLIVRMDQPMPETMKTPKVPLFQGLQ